MHCIQVHSLGLKPYREVWDIQRTLQTKLIYGDGEESLIVCSHPPVLTIGRSGKVSNVIARPELLAEQGIDVLEVERGGDVTYHGPEQVVLYPILDLNHHYRDVGWYMRSLEEVVIRLLAWYGIGSERTPGRSGVWVNQGGLRKISALGVRISRWCTMHGVSINIRNCRAGFSLIRPCGLVDIEVTSMEEEKNAFLFDSNEISFQVIHQFCSVFGVTANAETGA